MAAPGIPEMLLAGREREFLTRYALPAMSGDVAAFSEQDVDELVRVYAQPGGWTGASGLYRSALTEGDEIRQIVAGGKLTMPVLSVSAGGALTHATLDAVADDVTHADIEGAGHFTAFEAPEALAAALLDFYRGLER